MEPRGQASVEAALVVPLFILIALSLIELARAQQAWIAVQGAAFHAARAGVVWNGDPLRMTDAARASVLPTMGGTTDAAGLAKAWERERALDDDLKQSGGLVRVDTLAPTEAATDELEFDERPVELEVRVRFLHELKIPLGAAVVFDAFMVAAALQPSSEELETVWSLAHPEAGEAPRYFVPLRATYRLRMQSAFYRRFLGTAGQP